MTYLWLLMKTSQGEFSLWELATITEEADFFNRWTLSNVKFADWEKVSKIYQWDTNPEFKVQLQRLSIQQRQK